MTPKGTAERLLRKYDTFTAYVLCSAWEDTARYALELIKRGEVEPECTDRYTRRYTFWSAVKAGIRQQLTPRAVA